MKINRNLLLDKLYEFSKSTGGMVVGKPGIGKSYLLEQLQKRLDKEDTFCLMLRIDNAYDYTDEAITAQLELGSNWIEILEKVRLNSGQKAVFIFDAFDAARDEVKRTGFIQQIKKAKTRLKSWNIVVSVRTYDASKSKDLQAIFSRNPGGYGLPYRIDVPELTDNEVQEAVTGNEKLARLYTESGKKLQEVLRSPFFFKILEDIVNNSDVEQLQEIKHFQSEIQLLQVFWNRRILVSEKHVLLEQFLRDLTLHLVNVKSLNCNIHDFLPEFNDKDNVIFSYLRSENVLEEDTRQGIRIAFAHNILFDYAISRYCLDVRSEIIMDFIDKDPSRPFFFRPSFVYFFTHVWYNSQSDFWKLYNQLTESNDKAIVLFVRLSLNGTIASEYDMPEQLDTILQKRGTVEGNEAIANLLQSIRFIRTTTAAKDIKLLRLLSEHLEIRYIFDVSALLDRAVNLDSGANNTDCGYIARNLLAYALDGRNQQNKGYLDRMGAFSGVELVAKTFGTNVNASAAVLRSTFNLIKEPGFEIHYFTRLADAAKYIVKYDVALVRDLYYLIFSHEEMSQEKTTMNSSVVMALISNRRQDFEMCRYRLQEFLTEFLDSDAMTAVDTVIDIVNRHYLKEKVAPYIGREINFIIEDKPFRILRDMSSIWGDFRSMDRYVVMTRQVITYIAEQIHLGKVLQAKRLIGKYLQHCEVGFLWKQLFVLAAKYPEQLFDIFFPFVMIPQVVASPEVIYEVNEFIKAANGLLNDEQIREIENAIFSGYDPKHDYSIRTALSVLPDGRFQTGRAKQLMATGEKVENEPRVKSSFSSSPYTNEDWLSDQGVDLAAGTNKDLCILINKLETFNSSYINDVVSLKESEELWGVAIKLFEAIRESEQISADLYFSALVSCTRTAAVFCRDLANVPDDQLTIISEIISTGYNYTNPKYSDERTDLSPANGYSATPKIEAAAALIPLYIQEPGTKWLELIEDAVNHRNGVVRFNVINQLRRLFKNHYELYDRLLFERLEREIDSFVYAVLITNVYFKKDLVSEKCRQIINVANGKIEFLQNRSHFSEAYANLLLWMLEETELDEALQTLKNAFIYPEFCKMIIFKLFQSISIFKEREIYVRQQPQIDKKLGVVESYIDKVQAHFKASDRPIDLEQTEHSTVMEIINELITRIYFALETTDREFRSNPRTLEEENRKDLYLSVRRIFIKILQTCRNINERGFMVATGAHYFIQTLNSVLDYDPKGVLNMVANISRFSVSSGYTFDSLSIKEIIDLTEKLLADHRDILLDKGPFQDLLSILDIYINSGWVDALQLLWRLDEVFK